MSWPEPLPGMISTSGAFFATASSMIASQRAVDLVAPVVDVVQVELELHLLIVLPWHRGCQSAPLDPRHRADATRGGFRMLSHTSVAAGRPGGNAGSAG